MILAVAIQTIIFWRFTVRRKFLVEDTGFWWWLETHRCASQAIGVSMPQEKPIRVLATYDGYANITEIYVNGKFRGFKFKRLPV